MSKHLSKRNFYQLPSGSHVHPSRLIVRDGTLMWKHAFHNAKGFTALPIEEAHEAHIIKTAQRLEELNLWVSRHLELWNCLRPTRWYDPELEGFDEGIQVSIEHCSLGKEHVFDILKDNLYDHENLYFDDGYLTFVRC